MAIKINNTTVVDDSKNFFIEDIQFSDLTVASVASGSGGSNSESLYKPFALVRTLDNLDSTRAGGNLAYPAGGQFGYSAAISENYVIITTNAAYLNDTDNASGFAYVYDVNSGKLLHILRNPNLYSTAANDQFGRNVSISGDYAIFGVQLEDDLYGVNSGKAYIFNIVSGHLICALDNPNIFSTATSDEFGCAVGIYGNYAVVGAYQEDQTSYSNSGKAYIYRTITGDWTDVELLHIVSDPNGYSTQTSDLFGYTVSVYGNYAMITAYGEDDANGSSSGKVYMINLTTGGLNRTYSNPNVYGTGSSDYFGRAISYHGNYVAISAWYEDSSTGNQSGAVYIFSAISGTLIKTLTNPAVPNDASNYFGYSLEMFGNYLVIGAYGYNTNSGRTYVYKTTTGDWTDTTLVRTIENPNVYGTTDNDYFGWAVGISGNNIVATAYLEDDSLGNVQSTYSGRAYIFAVDYVVKVKNIINDKVTGLATTIHAPSSLPVIEVFGTDPSGSSGDKFGWPIVSNDNYVAASAIYDEYYDVTIGTRIDAGKVTIFDSKTGKYLKIIDNPQPAGSDLFGRTLAISDDYLFIGVMYDDPGAITDSGQVFIYNINTSSIINTLTNPNNYSSGNTDLFGSAVAVTGNYLIVSAYGEDDAGGDFSGVVYIYQTTTGDWTDATLLYTITNPNAYSTSNQDYFGSELSVSGNYAIVSAHLEDDASGVSSGKVYIFDVTTGALVHTLDNPNAYSTTAGDIFGVSVAMDGNYAVVGAWAEDGDDGLGFASGTGKAYVFKTTTGDWTDTSLVYILKNPNSYFLELIDSFGTNVTISHDYIAISSEESNPSGISAGAVYVYNKFTGRLIHTIKNPTFDFPQTGDEFGRGTSISNNRIYISSWGSDLYSAGIRSDAGKFYIYDMNAYSLEDKLIKYLNT